MGSRSPVWRKIMADLYKCDVHTLKQEEGPAYVVRKAGFGLLRSGRLAGKRKKAGRFPGQPG